MRLKVSYNHGTPPVPTLEHLREAVARSRHVYILLDALDECPADDTRDDVLSAIQTMRQWSLLGLHLLATSQNGGSTTIATMFQLLLDLELDRFVFPKRFDQLTGRPLVVVNDACSSSTNRSNIVDQWYIREELFFTSVGG